MKDCDCKRRRILAARLASIPKRFQFACFENFRAKNEIQAGTHSMISQNPTNSYFISGPYGEGKTHLLVAQFREVAVSGYPCQFWTTADLLTELRKVELDTDYTSRLMECVKYFPKFHLFWDDCDKFKPTDFKGQALFDLMDTIYRRQLRISVTSNYNLVSLSEFEKLHPAIIRRIDDMCAAVQV